MTKLRGYNMSKEYFDLLIRDKDFEILFSYLDK